jgi:hypothetical protein
MGILSFLFGTGRSTSSGSRKAGGGGRRPFARPQKRPNPNSKRSLGNTSRYRRF